MTLMPKIKNSEYGFGLVPPLTGRAVVIVIVFVGLRALVNNQSPPISTLSINYSGSKGNLNDTYTYKDNVLPNMPSDYQLLRQGLTASGQSETDYITAASSAQVRTGATMLCRTHQFSFRTTTDADTNIECLASYDWQFNILPASNLIQQSWYKIDQFSETQLSQMIYLQVLSNRVVCECPEIPANVSPAAVSKYCAC
jgi:hypothetical protein